MRRWESYIRLVDLLADLRVKSLVSRKPYCRRVFWGTVDCGFWIVHWLHRSVAFGICSDHRLHIDHWRSELLFSLSLGIIEKSLTERHNIKCILIVGVIDLSLDLLLKEDLLSVEPVCCTS